MNDDLRLLGLLTDQPDPTLPTAELHDELGAAADQLAADLMSGGFGMLLPASERGRLVSLTFAMLRWGDRAHALAELARPQSRRERPRRWWRRIAWRIA